MGGEEIDIYTWWCDGDGATVDGDMCATRCACYCVVIIARDNNTHCRREHWRRRRRRRKTILPLYYHRTRAHTGEGDKHGENVAGRARERESRRRHDIPDNRRGEGTAWSMSFNCRVGGHTHTESPHTHTHTRTPCTCAYVRACGRREVSAPPSPTPPERLLGKSSVASESIVERLSSIFWYVYV